MHQGSAAKHTLEDSGTAKMQIFHLAHDPKLCVDFGVTPQVSTYLEVTTKDIKLH